MLLAAVAQFKRYAFSLKNTATPHENAYTYYSVSLHFSGCPTSLALVQTFTSGFSVETLSDFAERVCAFVLFSLSVESLLLHLFRILVSVCLETVRTVPTYHRHGFHLNYAGFGVA